MLSPVIAIHSAHQFPSLDPATTTDDDAIGLSYGVGWGLYRSKHGPVFFKEGHDDGWEHIALCFADGTGILIMTNSDNGEGIYKPVDRCVSLGQAKFPFEWNAYTPWNKRPPLPPKPVEAK